MKRTKTRKKTTISMMKTKNNFPDFLFVLFKQAV